MQDRRRGERRQGERRRPDGRTPARVRAVELTHPLLFDPSIQDTQLALDEAIANERWGQARDLALTELASIREVEQIRDVRLHKGDALYNLGVVVFGESPSESRRLVMAARVEDARTYRSIPGEAVAGRVLRELFRFSSGLISTHAVRAFEPMGEDRASGGTAGATGERHAGRELSADEHWIGILDNLPGDLPKCFRRPPLPAT